MAKVLVRSLLSLKPKRLFTASATTSTSPAVQSSGSAAESAMSISENIKNAEKSASFFKLFRDYGFEDSNIQKFSESKIARSSPQNLKSKLDYFVENGFTGELLHKLIVSGPHILLGSLDARIKPNLLVLKQYLDSNEKVVTAINRFSWNSTTDLRLFLIPKIEFLINEGVPINRVSHLLLTHPRAFMLSHDRIAYAVKTCKEFGIAPDEGLFIHCLRVVCQVSESNLKKKLQVFKSFGYSDVEVLSALKKSPTFLSLSEEKLSSKIGFYLNTMKLEPDTVIGCPYLLTYSVEKIRARYEVLEILKSKKLVRGLRFASMITTSEDQFLEKYVIKYAERVPELLDIYNGILNERKKQGK